MCFAEIFKEHTGCSTEIITQFRGHISEPSVTQTICSAVLHKLAFEIVKIRRLTIPIEYIWECYYK